MNNLAIVLITFIVTFYFSVQLFSTTCYVVGKKKTDISKTLILDDGSIWVRQEQEN